MIEVRDTGMGISPDVLPRIFEPFFTTRRDRGGTGLGLSTVHGIVRQSDGFLTVDSEPGRGTSLRIYLPRHEGPETPAAPEVAPAMGEGTPAAGGCVVLLVDDEEMVRTLTARALTQRGWTVLACDSAESALERLRERDGKPPKSPLAALVSDVVMPGMDGPALVRAVRTRHPDVPAILISGYAEESLRAALASEKIFFCQSLTR
jgi:two-component system cell cycle sensor histidine kinase/response regulator CckA